MVANIEFEWVGLNNMQIDLFLKTFKKMLLTIGSKDFPDTSLLSMRVYPIGVGRCPNCYLIAPNRGEVYYSLHNFKGQGFDKVDFYLTASKGGPIEELVSEHFNVLTFSDKNKSLFFLTEPYKK